MTTNFLVIDTHNHFVPNKATNFIFSKDRTDDNKSSTPPRSELERAGLIESRLHVMDEAGVNMAVLNMSALSPYGLDLCRILNDGYAEIVSKHPDRFIACAHVPLGGSQDIIDELDRTVNELGFKAVSLVTSTSTHTVDSEEVYPLYEKLSQLDIPIIIHPTLRFGVWGGLKYKMSAHISREYDVAKATVEVMYGVLNRFPGLQFIMPHHGGGMPVLKGRVMAWCEPEGWVAPENAKPGHKTPRQLKELGLDKAFEDLFGQIYFDTAGFGGWMPITEAAVKTIRTDRLCFGTDYPFEILEACDVKGFINDIKLLDIPEQEKRNILGENIKRLFKL